MRPLRAALAALFCFALLLPTQASAWTPIDSSRPVWPSTYSFQLNQNGSASMGFSDVERILQVSFDTWTNPACSAYAYRYNSTTSRSSTGNGDEQNVHGFLGSWPGEYGDPSSVIGITVNLTSAGGGAPRIFESDVNFNEDTWLFVERSPSSWNQADLESIATHEYGHSLGLGHSTTGSATMYGAYDGGTGARSLHPDDIDGVCALYPSGISGDDDDDDDDSGPPSGDCLICEPCSSPEDCGPNGVCAQFSASGPAVCTELCPSNSCPGASVCVMFTDGSGGDYPLCVNEQADTRGICPGDWDCVNGFGNGGDDDDDSSPTGDDDDATGDDDDDATGDDDDEEEEERRGCACSAAPANGGSNSLILVGLIALFTGRRRRG